MRQFTAGTAPQRCQCHYHGHVQGVGFRYTVQNLAVRYNVLGYVKNLPDGRVELVVEGPQEEIDALLADVSRKMSCFIRGVNQSAVPVTGEFSQFTIRH